MYKVKKKKSETASDIHITIDIGGKHTGCLDLNSEKLWALIAPLHEDSTPVDWMDEQRYQKVIQAAVILKLITRLRNRLHRNLEEEVGQAKVDLENFCSKCEVAAIVFGRAQQDIERLAVDYNCTLLDFYAFFWKYMLDERETIDLREEWNSSRNG